MKIIQCLVLGSAVTLMATGCVYRINIQQGNFLNQGAVDTVKEGMTRSQVRYLLGTPMVADSFNKERWDYIYYLKKGRTRHVDSRRVTVHRALQRRRQLAESEPGTAHRRYFLPFVAAASWS